MRKLAIYISILVLALTVVSSYAQQLQVSYQPNTATFPLVAAGKAASIYVDGNDAKVVSIVVKAFVEDIKEITGQQIRIINQADVFTNDIIIAGTIGQSLLLDELVKSGELQVDDIRAKWECFKIIPITQKNGSKQLVIAGSDRRGTAFGIFHLSQLIGVSPWKWWADVRPKKQTQLFVAGSYSSKEPSVTYRGIFINDEDWGMQPWAAKNIDTDIKDIGPKTYAKVFELLLRLKANYIWPAMHPCTKAFYYYKENPKVANDYAIVVGGSHCEPMLRNNVGEWSETFEEEYGKKPGEWRYDVNKDEIYKYWDDRIKESESFESVYTVGMRGVHDGSMPGPKDPEAKRRLLENIIADQRKILGLNIPKPVNELPQIFVPYKEVLDLYRRGMNLADDITIVWPDDNYGYIRQFPNEQEQKRSGGNGVYYHMSYWGSPRDYLWLCSTAPALIGLEMKRAYDNNARKVWVFNVGDIKPAEFEMQFALDMAYDISNYDPADPAAYTRKWATQQFGAPMADKITFIKLKYYELAASGKPEQLDMIPFTTSEMEKRIADYELLVTKVNSYKKSVGPSNQDAYFEMIEYPAKAALAMNRKLLYTRMAEKALADSRSEAAEMYAKKAMSAFNDIRELTAVYNHSIAGGKWDSMMSWHPRDLAVFKAPPIVDSLSKKVSGGNPGMLATIPVASYSPIALHQQHHTKNLSLLPGVGITSAALQLSSNSAAEIEITNNLPAGNYTLVIKCLPLFPLQLNGQISCEVHINQDIKALRFDCEAGSKTWMQNVVNGYAQAAITFKSTGNNKILIHTKDPSLIISTIGIYKAE